MAIEFLDDSKVGISGIVLSWKCTGEHDGPPITCFIYDPWKDYDEDGPCLNYTKIEWDVPAGCEFPDHCTVGRESDYLYGWQVRDDAFAYVRDIG